MKKRYVSNPNYNDKIRAAEEYVKKACGDTNAYLFLKPYDPMPGHAAYFSDMYSLLGLL